MFSNWLNLYWWAQEIQVYIYKLNNIKKVGRRTPLRSSWLKQHSLIFIKIYVAIKQIWTSYARQNVLIEIFCQFSVEA